MGNFCDTDQLPVLTGHKASPSYTGIQPVYNFNGDGMPSVSKNQRIASAIAEHEPGKLYARNKAMLGMTKQQLHDFASTKEKGLPKKVRKGKTAPMRDALRAKI